MSILEEASETKNRPNLCLAATSDILRTVREHPKKHFDSIRTAPPV